MKFTPYFLLAVASLLLSSCLEIKSTVIANKDGTATIEETTLLSAQLAAMMRAGGSEGAQIKGIVMDKSKAEERAAKLGEGVTVKSYEEIKMPDGRSGVKVVYAVPHLDKLSYVPFAPEQPGKTVSKMKPMTFALSGQTLTITNPDVDKKQGGEGKPKKNPEEIAQMKAQMGMMRMMFAGMRISVEVKGANGIASTDATHFKDGVISYLDIQFDKLVDHFDVFAEVVGSGDSGVSMSEAAQKFGNEDGLKLEGKKVVTVELK